MLDYNGEVIACGVRHADTDIAALTAVRAWLGKYPAVEVWKGPYSVATVSSTVTATCSDQSLGSVAWKPGEHVWPEPDLHPAIP